MFICLSYNFKILIFLLRKNDMKLYNMHSRKTFTPNSVLVTLTLRVPSGQSSQIGEQMFNSYIIVIKLYKMGCTPSAKLTEKIPKVNAQPIKTQSNIMNDIDLNKLHQSRNIFHTIRLEQLVSTDVKVKKQSHQKTNPLKMDFTNKTKYL